MQGKFKWRGRGLASAVVSVALVAGVASATSAASSKHATGRAASGLNFSSIAIATPAKADDYGWNAQGVAGLKAAAKAYGIKVKVVTNIGYHDAASSCASRWPPPTTGLIIAHASGYDTRPQQVAAQTRSRSSPTISRDAQSPGTLSNITTSSSAGRLPRRHPRRADDQDGHDRRDHLRVRHELVRDGPAASSPARAALTRRSRSSPRRSARPPMTTRPAASASRPA